MQPELDTGTPAPQPTRAGSFNAAVADVITALEQIHGLGASPETLARVLRRAAEHYDVDLSHPLPTVKGSPRSKGGSDV